MTSKLKCPVCNHELYQTASECLTYCCLNKDCPSDFKFAGSKEIWQALIQAKQDLEIARQALEEYANKDNWGCIEDDRDRVCHTYWYFDGCDDGGWGNAQKALEQIEHKEENNG